MIHFIKQSKTLFLLCSMATLSGCLSPVKIDNQHTYMLNSLPASVPSSHHKAGTILVLPPETRPIYNTTQMAYTIKPYQIAYFSINQWGETPGQMLHPLLTQTLQNTRAFRAVVTPPFVGPYRYVLSTQILTFEQDFTQRPALLRLTARVQLMGMIKNQIIATRVFSITTPLYQSTPYGGVVAANQATEQLLKDIARFCIIHTSG